MTGLATASASSRTRRKRARRRRRSPIRSIPSSPPSARPSCRIARTRSRGRSTPSTPAPSSTCSSTGRARIPRSRGKRAWPARRPRSTASCTCATVARRRPAASRACASPRWKATSSLLSACSRPRIVIQRLALLIATVAGVGHAPLAPGTVASALTAVALGIASPSRPALIVFVIAEVAGMALSVLTLPLTPVVLLAGFVLFRLFDVVKPYPANALQRLPGGVGVMIDDLVAGLYALLVLLAARALMGWP